MDDGRLVILAYVVGNIYEVLPVVVANAINAQYFWQKGPLSENEKKSSYDH